MPHQQTPTEVLKCYVRAVDQLYQDYLERWDGFVKGGLSYTLEDYVADNRRGIVGLLVDGFRDVDDDLAEEYLRRYRAAVRREACLDKDNEIL